jgi:hypothetical protein
VSTAQSTPYPPVSSISSHFRWLIPSLSDCLIAALGAWLLLYTIGGSSGVLQDVNTGLHIRTGELILEHQAVPKTDPFSFSKPDGEWHAWEWLSDVALAAAWRLAGLPGVVMFSIAAILFSVWISVGHMMRRGANALVAIVLLHVGIAVSSVHYLARPHIFTLGLMALAWKLIDDDRREPGRRVWLLVPITAIWANLHGGFAGVIITLVALAAGLALERKWQAAGRYCGLGLACLGAALCNPRGVSLHWYMLQFFRGAWVRELVQDFQPPRFGGEGGLYFEILLFGGLAVAVLLASRREFASALVLLAWAHAALSSVRHFAIFFLILAPLAAAEITRIISTRRDNVLVKLGEDYIPALARTSIWLPMFWVAAAAACITTGMPQTFPDSRAPVALVERHASTIAGSRVFTLDSWADYLVFRSYPEQRVFLDGRWDYYGEEIARDYMRLLNGQPGWESAMVRYRFDAALIPGASGLAAVLERDAAWKIVDRDRDVVLFRRQ